MRKILFLLFVTGSFWSCKQADNGRVEEKKYALKSQICRGDDCSKVEIEIPYFSGDKKSFTVINDEILQQVSSLISFAETGEQFENYEELMQNFIQSYEKIKTDFPNEPIPWEAKIDVDAERLSKQLVNVTYDFYTFTGGAHGNYGKISQFYDLETGKTVPVKQLFVNYSGFEKMVKNKFYAIYKLNEGDSLEEKGFMFEDNRFYLSDNIMISDDEVEVYYNPYEIAPYANGATELKFTFDEVKPYLNPVYFKN